MARPVKTPEYLLDLLHHLSLLVVLRQEVKMDPCTALFLCHPYHPPVQWRPGLLIKMEATLYLYHPRRFACYGLLHLYIINALHILTISQYYT